MASEAVIKIELTKLKENNIGSEYNSGVETHIDPVAFSNALLKLKKYDLLTLKNGALLHAFINPEQISNAIDVLDIELASQENLDKLFRLKNPVLEVLKELLYRIPKEKLTQTAFDDFMHRAQLKNPIREIHSYINSLLETNSANNDAQSRLTR